MLLLLLLLLLFSSSVYLLNFKHSCVFSIVFLHLTEKKTNLTHHKNIKISAYILVKTAANEWNFILVLSLNYRFILPWTPKYFNYIGCELLKEWTSFVFCDSLISSVNRRLGRKLNVAKLSSAAMCSKLSSFKRSMRIVFQLSFKIRHPVGLRETGMIKE